MKKYQKWLLGSLIVVVIGGFLAVMWNVLMLEDPTHWQVMNQRYIEENEAAESGQIVFLGDSLTEGFDIGAFLESDLVIYNRGIGGDTTSGVIQRLESNVLAISPSVIVLLIGVNDLHSGITPETILEHLDDILATLAAALPETEVYVESLYPTNTSVMDLSAYWDEIDALNPQIQSLTESYEYTFIDLHAALSDGDELNRDYAIDGLHLNAEGYEVVAAALAAAIPELRVKP